MYICSLTYNIFALLLLLSDGVLALYSSFLTNGSKDLGRSTLRRRQLPTVAITGIQGFGVQTRLEIRRLEQNVDQWNIFLLGLVRFQATDQSDLTSYYQIAGIHGRPYSAWDNVLSPPGVDSPGYCQHVLNSFLPWHRPYLALFEQTLYDHIIDAVNEFPRGPARQRYAAAALTWRFPYWDWAAPPPTGQSVYPSSLSESMVTVTMPNGTNTIPNPLHSYNFHPVSVQDFYYNPFASWNETKRYPTSWSLDATSQDDLVGYVLDNNRVSFQDRLYNLFTSYNNFTEFGNEAYLGSDISNADSLEAMHDAIHSIMGSNGHMTYLDYSAFDPAFWLHHAMIDRCFALWQALYPDSYVEPMAAIEQTFAIRVGDIRGVDSALEPFFSDSGRDYWTAASVRSMQIFGYTYPELEGSTNVSAVKEAINKLYGSSLGSSGISRRDATASKSFKREISAAKPDAQASPVAGEVVDGTHWHRQYVANIVSQKFALNGSYAICLFLGPFDQNASTWSTSPNLVGTHAVFAALSFVDAPSNPQGSPSPGKASSPIKVTGTMPLTSMLISKVESGELKSMRPRVVEAYLKVNLAWRVAMFDGSQVPIQDVVDLSITVVTAKVEPAATIDSFPQWSNFTKLTHITYGRLGGCKE